MEQKHANSYHSLEKRLQLHGRLSISRDESEHVLEVLLKCLEVGNLIAHEVRTDESACFFPFCTVTGENAMAHEWLEVVVACGQALGYLVCRTQNLDLVLTVNTNAKVSEFECEHGLDVLGLCDAVNTIARLQASWELSPRMSSKSHRARLCCGKYSHSPQSVSS